MSCLPPIPPRAATPGPACAEILEYAAKAPHLDFARALEQAWRDDFAATRRGGRRNRRATSGRFNLTQRQPPPTMFPFTGGD